MDSPRVRNLLDLLPLLARPLGETGHGAAMLAATLGVTDELFKNESWAMARSCKSQKFAQTLGIDFLTSEHNKGIAHALISYRRDSTEIIQGVARNILSEFADTDFPRKGNSLSYLVLSDANIGEALFERLLPFYHQMDGNRKSAFYLNPLFTHSSTTTEPPWNNTGYLVAAVANGNLSDPVISERVFQLMESRSKAGARLKHLSALLLRGNLPEELIRKIDSAEGVSAEQYSRLVALPEHQDMVKRNLLSGIRSFSTDDGMRVFILSNNVSRSGSSSLYRRAIEDEDKATGGSPGSFNLLAASALCCKNATRADFKRAWDRRNPALLNPIMARSPFVAEILQKNKQTPLDGDPTDLIIQYKKATPEMVLHALSRTINAEEYDVKKYIRVLSHTKFPWNEVSPAQISPKQNSADCDKAALMAGIIIGCVRSREFAEKVHESNSQNVPSHALAAIFTESSSSRRLTSVLVGDDADFASLAACHPNGEHIDVRKADRESKVFIESVRKRRYVPLLRGKGEGRSRTATLSIGID